MSRDTRATPKEPWRVPKPMTEPCRFAASAFLAALVFLACSENEASARPKPNIVLILVDDMGYSDLGC